MDVNNFTVTQKFSWCHFRSTLESFVQFGFSIGVVAMSGGVIRFDISLLDGASFFQFEQSRSAIIVDNRGALLGNLTATKTNEVSFHAKPAVKRPMQPRSDSAASTKKRRSINAPKPPDPSANDSSNAAGLAVQEPPQKVDANLLIHTLTKPNSNKKMYQCSFCAFQATVKSRAKRHIELKHLPSSVVFKCQTCSKDFKMKAHLKKHYIKIHSMPERAAQAMILVADF